MLIKPEDMKQIKVGQDGLDLDQPIFEIIEENGKNKVSKRINAMNLEEARRIALDQHNISVVEVERG